MLITDVNPPAIVLVHGWCSNQSLWKVQVEHLKKNYRVHTLDLSGHGAASADQGESSIHHFAEEVVALMATERLDDVVLVGHSMGGAVCAETAALCPEKVRAVILADTFLFDYGFFAEDYIAATLNALRTDMKGSVRALVFDVSAATAPDSLKEFIVEALIQTPPVVAIAAFDSLLRWNLVALLPKIKTQIYAINGDKINPEAARRYRQIIREYRMDGAGHFLHLEDPEKFNTILDSILEDIAFHAQIESQHRKD